MSDENVDIVRRLRRGMSGADADTESLLNDAAQEIERLRAGLHELARVEPLGSGMKRAPYGVDAHVFATSILTPPEPSIIPIDKWGE
jgi:hypothetical protein